MCWIIIGILSFLALFLFCVNWQTSKEHENMRKIVKAYEILLADIREKSGEPRIKLMARKRYK